MKINLLRYLLTLICFIIISTFSSCQYGCYMVVYDDYEHMENDIGDECTFLELKEGQKVASIGASTGYFEISCNLLNNTAIDFYIEDIDTICDNQAEIDGIVNFYEEQFNTTFKGTFTSSIGTENSTKLPQNTFDRVLCRISFHHFPSPENMLSEIHNILKADGLLIIAENLTPTTGILDPFCKSPLYAEKDLIELVEKNGFTLIDIIWTNKEYIESLKKPNPQKDTPYKMFKFKKKNT
ncbi:MAG: methyltransferase domain-containing protein [Cytophagales bacterium]|nr:MAG: methyltransferase domain-containing protein [Cytophagales bacterium]